MRCLLACLLAYWSIPILTLTKTTRRPTEPRLVVIHNGLFRSALGISLSLSLESSPAKQTQQLTHTTLKMQRYLEQDADGGAQYDYSDDLNASVACPSWAPIVGFTGIACAVCFASEYSNSSRGRGRALIDIADGLPVWLFGVKLIVSSPFPHHS